MLGVHSTQIWLSDSCSGHRAGVRFEEGCRSGFEERLWGPVMGWESLGHSPYSNHPRNALSSPHVPMWSSSIRLQPELKGHMVPLHFQIEPESSAVGIC